MITLPHLAWEVQEKSKMKPNIKMSDIAKEAGVSISTVGRVVNNSGYVSEEVRQRVENAVKELGYVPNAMARTLKQQKSGIIGSLVSYNPNQLYQKINESLLAAADKNKYKLITLESRGGKKDESELLNLFIGMQVEGVVIISNGGVPVEALNKLHALHIPVVAVERGYDVQYVDNLVVKDFEGAYGAASEFIKSGHKRVALIASELFEAVEEERYNGFKKAFEEKNLELCKDYICLMNNYSRENGYIAMKELLSMEERPTAVFCTADTFAAGAMQAIYEKGLRVPEDISIIGYDNVISKWLAPQIDSVDLALDEIGGTVFSLLMERMEEIDKSAVTRYINTVYIKRGTVKNVKKQ